MTVVLHACCGPCASACVPRLADAGHDVTLLFANSNLDTREEYERRKAAAAALAAHDGVAFAALDYDHGEWLREVAAGYENEPEKGRRCERCFRYNLGKAAAWAAAHGCDAFTTSLTVSPHKPSALVFAAGRAAASLTRQPVASEKEVATVHTDATGCRVYGMRREEGPAFGGRLRLAPIFLEEDFKKKEGFKLSVRRAAELGLYRQSYCGCEFSRHVDATACRVSMDSDRLLTGRDKLSRLRDSDRLLSGRDKLSRLRDGTSQSNV